MSNISLWQLIGFLIALYAVIGNDSLQTLGTYLESNKDKTSKTNQILFICAITAAILFYGWAQNQAGEGYGDPAWGRLKEFTVPQDYNWFYIIPPISVLFLTQLGAPVSTSFIILTTFSIENSWTLLISSLTGYAISLCISIVTYGAGKWIDQTKSYVQENEQIKTTNNWQVLQWISTSLLWSQWLVLDAANIFIYLPRDLNLAWMSSATGLFCVGICILVSRGGGPIQDIVKNKTDTENIRSATIIDLVYGIVLFITAKTTSFPLSTTCIFIGLLAGREVGLRFWLDNEKNSIPFKLLANDLIMVLIGIIVSLIIAICLQPVLQN